MCFGDRKVQLSRFMRGKGPDCMFKTICFKNSKTQVSCFSDRNLKRSISSADAESGEENCRKQHAYH